MTDLHKAEAAAREAESARQAAYKSGDKAEIAAAHARCANTQDNLLAALDAARGEAVAWVDVADAESGPYEFHGIEKLPAGKHHLFSAPPAALAVPEGVREAWQRLKPRLTPDRERVFAAITETLIRFGHDDATMLQDCIFAADAAIAAAVPEGMPVATRFRHKPTDALPGHGWIYEDGDVASTLTDKPFPGLEVQLLRATTVWPQAAASSKGVVTKIGGKDDASGCYKVLLGEKEYVRHGDMYTVWFESRDPRTGEIRRRNRIVMNASTRARIDSAISAMLAAANKEDTNG